KLYVSDLYPSRGIWQFDLSSNNLVTIAASKIFLGNVPGAASLKLGPDGKIYFLALTNLPPSIGTINFPNLAGAACGFTPGALPIPIGAEPYSGFPNVVPVIVEHWDTVFTTSSDTALCFAMEYMITPPDTTGGHYRWNTGDTTPS